MRRVQSDSEQKEPWKKRRGQFGDEDPITPVWWHWLEYLPESADTINNMLFEIVQVIPSSAAEMCDKFRSIKSPLIDNYKKNPSNRGPTLVQMPPFLAPW